MQNERCSTISKFCCNLINKAYNVFLHFKIALKDIDGNVNRERNNSRTPSRRGRGGRRGRARMRGSGKVNSGKVNRGDYTYKTKSIKKNKLNLINLKSAYPNRIFRPHKNA